MWHGMRMGTWWRLLASGRFAVSISRFPMAVIASCLSPLNDIFAGLQWLLHGRGLAKTQLAGPPIFIVGHWRSGTTLMHELMIRDDRFAFPSTYECFAPSHFLSTSWFFRWFCGWMLPEKRPMDDMEIGWDRPQEDEFALMIMGQPSPYRRMAFPNQSAPDLDYLDWRNVDDTRRREWVEALRCFLKVVTYRKPRPLVLKSPTHTGRIAFLAAAFPSAKFIHITRDPRSLVPSTMRLWRALDEAQHLQTPAVSDEALERYVLECGSRMYNAFHAGRAHLEASALIDIRYEDLVADPVAVLERVYQHLQLHEFERVRPLHEAWVAEKHRQYRINQHRISDEQAQRIFAAWPDYFQRYGYTTSTNLASTL
jgi:hypothetical protein